MEDHKRYEDHTKGKWKEYITKWQQAYRVPIRLIPNGIVEPKSTRSTGTLTAFGLTPSRYALVVARIDEQKRQLDLIEAFARAGQSTWKLALVLDTATLLDPVLHPPEVKPAPSDADNVEALRKTAAALREMPAGGAWRAISRARSWACGSAQSSIQPCASHSRTAPASRRTEIAQRFSVRMGWRFGTTINIK